MITNKHKCAGKYDVIVIGGGHAGCEAASGAARMGARTLLLTHKKETIGEMSCNPAIGGLGKGHLVREIDALGGLMGKIADKSGIQFRVLGRSRGPAVRGPRTQSDRGLYKQNMQEALGISKKSAHENLDTQEGAVHDIICDETATIPRIQGVICEDGRAFLAPTVVLTTGTFLNGVIHCGQERTPAGRWGDAPARGLSERLYGFGFQMGRLKTGTPARLATKSINMQGLDWQKADTQPEPFSFLNDKITIPQIACAITHTNENTHAIIRENLHQSAIHGGGISGVGPRYCPSIEDKIHRFADRPSHQVFLEPEGLPTSPHGAVIYPNGISTSLPPKVQTAFLRTMKGLENCEVIRFGYAIEYDYIDPRQLRASLETHKVSGLFLAGQINGTTGYEEAGAQGLMAGINAALQASAQGADSQQSKRFVLDRSQAYIGVLIDDLITKGVSEPYRMFTSRAEYRLVLRADNADQRLTPLAHEMGLITAGRAVLFHAKQKALSEAHEQAKALRETPRALAKFGFKINQDGVRRTVLDLLAYPDIDFTDLCRVWPQLQEWPFFMRQDLEAEAVYSGYIERQTREIAAFKRDEGIRLPAYIDYTQIGGISHEAGEKLAHIRPATLGQASRIEGVTPGALAAVLAHVKRARQTIGK